MSDSSATDADRTMDDAVNWVVRVGDPAFADWPALEAWLSASPSHAEAYHAVASAEADAVVTIASAHASYKSTPAPAPAPAARRRARTGRLAPWAGAAIAASLIGFVAHRTQTPPPAGRSYATAPGVRRTIAFADGSHAVLNGDTRLTVDGADSRVITLDRGEALFTVRHDAAHPFRVRVGDADVIDVGTRFDVVLTGETTRVAVSEGMVDWRRGGNSVRVAAGHSLHARDGVPDVALGAADKEAIGGWTTGQLDYDGAPLADVAADVSRALGVAVRADPAVADRPFRGAVRLDGGADAVLPRLAALAGLEVRRDGSQWRLLASP